MSVTNGFERHFVPPLPAESLWELLPLGQQIFYTFWLKPPMASFVDDCEYTPMSCFSEESEIQRVAMAITRGLSTASLHPPAYPGTSGYNRTGCSSVLVMGWGKGKGQLYAYNSHMSCMRTSSLLFCFFFFFS